MSAGSWAVLAVGAILILIVSLPSLRAGWRHALPRAGAFGMLLGLALLNSDAWLVNAGAPDQIVSWLFLSGSIPIALHALVLLRRHGRPRGSIDHTSSMVERGIYRYIRHPLYLSLGMVAIGAMAKRISAASLALGLGVWALLMVTARLEERFNLEKFGPAYRQYMRRTRMFVPGIL